ncbi:MAG: hypothetical protein V2A76_08680 [Planctomycetota bacterium]
MLLVPFVENAFKHGARGGEGFIHVAAAVNGTHLSFSVENSKGRPATDRDEAASATGLENVRRRLELLYPGKHRLQTHDHDDRYRIELEIEL